MVYALTNVQLIFVIISSVIVSILLILFLFIPGLRLYHKKYYRNYYYKKIYSIAQNNDYYLVNNFVFKLDKAHDICIDHILFGEKYIYVLVDKYYSGDLTGNASDPDLVLIGKNGKRNYIENPFYSFNKLLSMLSTATGINTDLMIGVTVVNNNCRMNIQTNSKQFFLVQRNRLTKLIKTIEARDVGLINGKQLQKAVLTVDKLNMKERY